MGEGMFFEEVADRVLVEWAFDGASETGADIGLLSVADRFDEKVSEGAAFELQLAEDIENLAA